MANVWLKIRVWTKVILFGLLLIYITVFIIQNSENHATLWVWFGRGKQVQTSVLKLVLATLLLGVVGTLLVRTTFRTVRQFREVRERSRSQRLERDIADMKTKAGMLRSRGSEPQAAASEAAESSVSHDPLNSEP
jgi:hypothetical protein